MRVFDFKSFYSIYKEALIDDNQTAAVASLFSPILSLRFFPANIKDKDDKTPLVIDSRKASEWVSEIRENFYNACNSDLIKQCCRGKQKTSYGYHWEFVKE